MYSRIATCDIVNTPHNTSFFRSLPQKMTRVVIMEEIVMVKAVVLKAVVIPVVVVKAVALQ